MPLNSQWTTEVQKRRTFAIISHPDAGKTTITDKILYLGGAIREAGEVRGKSGTKAATSDWMALEQQRGVSITSSVMQFSYHGLIVNLLDTPGHKDFGEDTYRTLVAADSAAMLIDAAKGVEEQTRKLYEVCRLRKIPIFTFANKMDREGIEPLALIDDVESTLKIRCYPVTWPLGMGDRFKGVFHRLELKFYLYSRGEEKPEIISVSHWRDERIQKMVSSYVWESFASDMELLEGALGPFQREEFLKGEVSLMTFGSAKYNWGVDLFLELFAEYAPAPGPRVCDKGLVNPDDSTFTGFIFKIQANMDRKHRDRLAFIRICSGRFERGMKVQVSRTEREIRLSYASQLMARERETVDEAFAGDILGVVDTGHLSLGDTLTNGKRIEFGGIPRFSPEKFARVTVKDPLKRKTLQKAVLQLSEEGAIQLFVDPLIGPQEPIIGVVGELQFDVLMFRLNDEYQLEARLERLPLGVARWPIVTKTGERFFGPLKGGQKLYRDMKDQPVVLIEKEWDLQWLRRENSAIDFLITADISLAATTPSTDT